MKKRLFAFIFATVLATALNAYPAFGQTSQTIMADVPFPFTTNGKTLPAGTYRIDPLGDNRALWRISGTDHRGARAFLLAAMLTGSSDDDFRLTFHQYGGKYYLAGFNTASYEVKLPASDTEKALGLAQKAPARMRVTGIEAIGGGSR